MDGLVTPTAYIIPFSNDLPYSTVLTLEDKSNIAIASYTNENDIYQDIVEIKRRLDSNRNLTHCYDFVKEVKRISDKILGKDTNFFRKQLRNSYLHYRNLAYIHDTMLYLLSGVRPYSHITMVPLLRRAAFPNNGKFRNSSFQEKATAYSMTLKDLEMRWDSLKNSDVYKSKKNKITLFTLWAEIGDGHEGIVDLVDTLSLIYGILPYSEIE